MPFQPSVTRCVGILTAGGDCPGLNAAIRGITKAAIQTYGIRVVGILDGFRGLVENRMRPLEYSDMSGLLTMGGTILGTSRDKPRKMTMGGREMDMTETAIANARSNGFDCIVCLGGGGTQKNALHLANSGLNVITLPKTIDNDVGLTDVSFGFDTAVGIATNAIDRLHTTATSHDRIIVVETMGHKSGWLALAAGMAGGADVILMPEIPYDLHSVAEFLRERQRRYGKKFSIVVVAEGAVSCEEAEAAAKAGKRPEVDDDNDAAGSAQDADFGQYQLVKESLGTRLARQLQVLAATEARVTSLGHVQRGGTPSVADRLLATQLGVHAAELMAAGQFGVMVAARDGKAVPVPLARVAGVRKLVDLDHPWIRAAQLTGTHLGRSADEVVALGQAGRKKS